MLRRQLLLSSEPRISCSTRWAYLRSCMRLASKTKRTLPQWRRRPLLGVGSFVPLEEGDIVEIYRAALGGEFCEGVPYSDGTPSSAILCRTWKTATYISKVLRAFAHGPHARGQYFLGACGMACGEVSGRHHGASRGRFGPRAFETPVHRCGSARFRDAGPLRGTKAPISSITATRPIRRRSIRSLSAAWYTRAFARAPIACGFGAAPWQKLVYAGTCRALTAEQRAEKGGRAQACDAACCAR